MILAVLPYSNQKWLNIHQLNEAFKILTDEKKIIKLNGGCSSQFGCWRVYHYYPI
jgi:hypothetical protein